MHSGIDVLLSVCCVDKSRPFSLPQIRLREAPSVSVDVAMFWLFAFLHDNQKQIDCATNWCGCETLTRGHNGKEQLTFSCAHRHHGQHNDSSIAVSYNYVSFTLPLLDGPCVGFWWILIKNAQKQHEMSLKLEAILPSRSGCYCQMCFNYRAKTQAFHHQVLPNYSRHRLREVNETFFFVFFFVVRAFVFLLMQWIFGGIVKCL